MAKVNSTASDKQTDALTTTTNMLPSVTITTSPVVITAVQRKANIGNFETIDIYMAVAMPAPDLDLTDKDELERALTTAAEYGFSMAARETAQRYHLVKDSIK
jgi:hypothetical protein